MGLVFLPIKGVKGRRESLQSQILFKVKAGEVGEERELESTFLQEREGFYLWVTVSECEFFLCTPQLIYSQTERLTDMQPVSNYICLGQASLHILASGEKKQEVGTVPTILGHGMRNSAPRAPFSLPILPSND